MTDRWFLTSFAQGRDYIREMRGMMDTFREHHPDVPAIIGENPIPTDGLDWANITKHKAAWLHDVRRANPDLGAMLWVDADARFRRPVAPPHNGPIAAMRYSRWCTGTVWFLEDTPLPFFTAWGEFCEGSDHDEAGLAKALEFFDIRPVALSRRVSSVCSETIHGFRKRLAHDSSIVHWNMSRVGIVDNWPPSEEVRKAALLPKPPPIIKP
jgi:hypothetical protein